MNKKDKKYSNTSTKKQCHLKNKYSWKFVVIVIVYLIFAIALIAVDTIPTLVIGILMLIMAGTELGFLMLGKVYFRWNKERKTPPSEKH